MKAFVINEDQIKKVALVFAGILIAAFILGYYLGAKNLFSPGSSSQIGERKNAAEIAQKPEAVATIINETVKDKANTPISKKADKPEASKKVEKKIQKKIAKPVVSKKRVEKEQTKKAKSSTKKKVETKKVSLKSPPKKIAEKKKEVNKPDKVARAENIQNKKSRNNSVVESLAKKKDAGKKAINTSDKETSTVTNNTQNVQQVAKEGVAESAKRYYAIQAGMFASEANANSFIERLKTKQFDAYLSDFISSSGATKYNVRVGRFEQREQARVLLNEFQKSFSSPAYVVISK